MNTFTPSDEYYMSTKIKYLHIFKDFKMSLKSFFFQNVLKHSASFDPCA